MRSLALPAVLILSAPALAADDNTVKVTKTETTLEFRVGNEPATTYQFGGTVRVEKGEGTKPLAKPFFWPVNAPGGVPVTRAWPQERGYPGQTTDHFHQKSAWFCHGDVIPVGVELKLRSADKHVKGIDFWAEGGNHGRIVCVEVGEPRQVSANHVAVPTRNEWKAAEGLKVLDESRTVHLVALPAGRLIVLDIDLTAADHPVVFGDTKEGSMGVRVSDQVRLASKTGGVVTGSNGESVKAPAKDNLPVWGKPADWNDYSGTIDGKPAGIAVFDDAGNPYRASWHTRAYGLMAANPFGREGSGFPSQKGKTELVRLGKGEHLKLRYGIYSHGGDAATGKVAEAYKAFAEMK